MLKKRGTTRSCRWWPRARRSWTTGWAWRKTPRGIASASTGQLLRIWLSVTEEGFTFSLACYRAFSHQDCQTPSGPLRSTSAENPCQLRKRQVSWVPDTHTTSTSDRVSGRVTLCTDRLCIHRDLAGYNFTSRQDVEVDTPDLVPPWKLPEPVPLRTRAPLIQLEAVSFAYPEAAKDILRDVTVCIEQVTPRAIIQSYHSRHALV